MEAEANTISLTLHVDAGPDADAEELDRLTRQLLDELRDMEVESADLVKAEVAPAGTKAAEAITLGALVVAVAPTAISKLIEFFHEWSRRGENRRVRVKTQIGDRSVEVEYSPKAMSVDELRTLVDTLTGTLTKQSDAE